MEKTNKFKIIAGPCLVESYTMLEQTAETLLQACDGLDVELIFKSSYRKANRTSNDTFTGIGDEKALDQLSMIKRKFGLTLLTDFHSADEAAIAADIVDVLQIPAFLSRQTDIIKAAEATGKIINIKKGQFMAPEDAIKAANKISYTDKNKVWLTERGVSFGYHDLVVDFRSFAIMKNSGFPVIYDATHSVQKPSLGEQSGGSPEYISMLARAACTTGIDGIFFETHPNPSQAKSDSATQLPLSMAADFIRKIICINDFIKNLDN
ncbi:MAG: 3-deoxy-8-phosphooctulonate synthase [Candidatus Kapabacteria bacterium]|nr:3-deoxy-8-phosphooctulonate synthase [Candidatus Kapabacteria bacterium]